MDGKIVSVVTVIRGNLMMKREDKRKCARMLPVSGDTNRAWYDVLYSSTVPVVPHINCLAIGHKFFT